MHVYVEHGLSHDSMCILCVGGGFDFISLSVFSSKFIHGFLFFVFLSGQVLVDSDFGSLVA